MLSLLFLICNEAACMSASPPSTFQTKEQCESAGYAMLEEGQNQVKSGGSPPHKAMFSCHDWGTPA